MVCVQMDSAIKDMECQMQKENWDPGPQILKRREHRQQGCRDTGSTVKEDKDEASSGPNVTEEGLRWSQAHEE